MSGPCEIQCLTAAQVGTLVLQSLALQLVLECSFREACYMNEAV
jgi:hypothetical protein